MPTTKDRRLLDGKWPFQNVLKRRARATRLLLLPNYLQLLSFPRSDRGRQSRKAVPCSEFLPQDSAC